MGGARAVKRSVRGLLGEHRLVRKKKRMQKTLSAHGRLRLTVKERVEIDHLPAMEAKTHLLTYLLTNSRRTPPCHPTSRPPERLPLQVRRHRCRVHRADCRCELHPRSLKSAATNSSVAPECLVPFVNALLLLPAVRGLPMGV
jgi:hypothetical protein